jgi:hypothetical protein
VVLQELGPEHPVWTFIEIVEEFGQPLQATFVDTIEVVDPGADGELVELEVWRDPSAGALMAIESSFLDQVQDAVASPYNPEVFLQLPPERLQESPGSSRPS